MVATLMKEEIVSADLQRAALPKRLTRTTFYSKVRACIIDNSNILDNDKYGTVLRCVNDQFGEGFGCHQDIDRVAIFAKRPWYKPIISWRQPFLIGLTRLLVGHVSRQDSETANSCNDAHLHLLAHQGRRRSCAGHGREPARRAPVVRSSSVHVW